MKPSIVSAFAWFVVVFYPVSPALSQDVNARGLAASCFTCHGTEGNSVEGVPPSLAGRSSAELFESMKDFQSGKRPATIMHQQARGYTDAQLRSIGDYFASIKPSPPARPAKP